MREMPTLLIPCLAAALAGAPAMAAPRDAAPVTAGAVRLDWKYLIGSWTDTGDCSDVIEITGDRRFITSEGGEGLWHLEGDALTLTGEHRITIRIVPIDRDTMTVINEDGSLGRSTRCAARMAPRRTPPAI